MQAVPNEEDLEPQLTWQFEGLTVQQSRIEPSSLGEFPCIGEDGQALELHEGDSIAITVEAIVTSVEVGAGYKGGIQHKARKRIHHVKVLDGTQAIVGMRRRNQ